MGTLNLNQSTTKNFTGINRRELSSNKVRYEQKQKNKFTILHQNIRGIRNKVDEFLISLSTDVPQVICLTEHHLKREEIDNINFSQYTVGSFFCRRTYACGGVCILVHKDIQFDDINLDHFSKEKDFEISALKLHIMHNHFIIICIYRSPNGNFTYFLNQLEVILNKLYKISNKLILCGDFNINYLNEDKRRDLLDSLLASFNLFSTIKFATRVFKNSCTLIDNIFIDINLHEFLVYPFINGLSDHDAQVITLNNITLPSRKQIYYYRRDINDLSMSQFTFFLSFENWENVFSETNVNKAFNNFLNNFLRIFYTCFPVLKSPYLHKYKPWLTPGIRISCANKRKLYLDYRNSNDPDIRAHFKKYCRILAKVITRAKKFYFDKLLLGSKNKIKTTWNIVNSITSNGSPVVNVTPMNLKTQSSSNLQDMANAFNNYFLSVADKLSVKNSPGQTFANNKDFLSYLQQNFCHPFPSIKLSNTNTFEMEKVIFSLKPKNSHGYDEISTKILKISAPFVISPLTYIFNKVIQTGNFPDRLKFSEIKPLFKKGDKSKFNNYRPISLLPTFSKIIEKIIYKRLYAHVNKHNILAAEQFGFREKLSTEVATHILLNNILSAFDKKNYVGGLFCDLQKAFDCVNHDTLLKKMEFYGITGTANKLMKSYLQNRYQRVVMKDAESKKEFSKWELIKHGVPQGSILGPLLFLIYINDFPLSVKKMGIPILFADDTSIIISKPNPEEFENNINLVLNETVRLFNSNFLALNCDKSYFIQFFLKKV
jgi:exonuclease III